MLPAGVGHPLDHGKAAHRRLPAGSAHRHREAAQLPAVLQHRQVAVAAIEHQFPLEGRHRLRGGLVGEEWGTDAEHLAQGSGLTMGS